MGGKSDYSCSAAKGTTNACSGYYRNLPGSKTPEPAAVHVRHGGLGNNHTMESDSSIGGRDEIVASRLSAFTRQIPVADAVSLRLEDRARQWRDDFGVAASWRSLACILLTVTLAGLAVWNAVAHAGAFFSAEAAEARAQAFLVSGALVVLALAAAWMAYTYGTFDPASMKAVQWSQSHAKTWTNRVTVSAWNDAARAFEAACIRRGPGAGAAALPDARWVGWTPTELLLADMATDRLLWVPVKCIRELRAETRLSTTSTLHTNETTPGASGFVPALGGALLFGAVGAVVGAAAARTASSRLSSSVSTAEYCSVVDAFTSQADTPVITVVFGADEASAKLCYATLSLARQQALR